MYPKPRPKGNVPKSYNPSRKSRDDTPNENEWLGHSEKEYSITKENVNSKCDLFVAVFGSFRPIYFTVFVEPTKALLEKSEVPVWGSLLIMMGYTDLFRGKNCSLMFSLF